MVYYVCGRRVRLIFILYSALLLIFIQNSALGGEADLERQTNQPIAKWQLKFSVGPNFTLRQFEGFKIFLQRSISSKGAVRFGIGLRGYYYSSDTDRFNVYPEEHFYRENNWDRKETIVTTTINYIRYLNGRGSITPFWGMGPVLDFSKYGWKDILRYPENEPIGNSYDSDTKILKVGLTTILGADWRLNKALNIHIEYGLGFHYDYRKYYQTSQNTLTPPIWEYKRNSTKKSYRIIANSVRIGLSLAF